MSVSYTAPVAAPRVQPAAAGPPPASTGLGKDSGAAKAQPNVNPNNYQETNGYRDYRTPEQRLAIRENPEHPVADPVQVYQELRKRALGHGDMTAANKYHKELAVQVQAMYPFASQEQLHRFMWRVSEAADSKNGQTRSTGSPTLNSIAREELSPRR